MIDWHRFCELIRSHERFLLTSHIRPDCDALGSELAMAGILESLGKQVLIVNGQQTPPNLAFIDPGKKLRLGVDVQPADLAEVQVLLVLDTSARAQLGPMADVVRTTKAHKAVLDHHIDSDDMGAELFKDVEAEATGRLVLEAAKHLRAKLTAEIARALFAAMATDTGWFRFSSVRGDTMRAAGADRRRRGSANDLYRALRAGIAGSIEIARTDSGSNRDRARRPTGLHRGTARGFRRHRRAGLRH